MMHQREMEMGERRARLEEIRSATTASAAAYDKAAQQQLKAEEKSKGVSASAQRAAVTAVEKMRVAAEAAAAAYDAAAERERIRAKGENPPEDRALREMMGGRLEKAIREKDTIWIHS